MDEICAICQRDMSDNKYTLPECGHAFHLDCLMMWFRSPREYRQDFGSCPMCRTLPANPIGWSTLKGRCRLLKRLAQKKTAHPELKKAAKRLSETVTKKNEAVKAHAEYRRRPEVKIIRKEDKRLGNHKWRMRTLVRKREHELAAFDPIGALSEAFLWKNSVV